MLYLDSLISDHLRTWTIFLMSSRAVPYYKLHNSKNNIFIEQEKIKITFNVICNRILNNNGCSMRKEQKPKLSDSKLLQLQNIFLFDFKVISLLTHGICKNYCWLAIVLLCWHCSVSVFCVTSFSEGSTKRLSMTIYHKCLIILFLTQVLWNPSVKLHNNLTKQC